MEVEEAQVVSPNPSRHSRLRSSETGETGGSGSNYTFLRTANKSVSENGRKVSFGMSGVQCLVIDSASDVQQSHSSGTRVR